MRQVELKLARLLRLPDAEFARYADRVFDGWLRRKGAKTFSDS
jgi:hypothetical protein